MHFRLLSTIKWILCNNVSLLEMAKSKVMYRQDRQVTRSQTTAILHVAAMTPILPRNKTNDPTLLMAITRSTLLVRTPNAQQLTIQAVTHCTVYSKNCLTYLTQSQLNLIKVSIYRKCNQQQFMSFLVGSQERHPADKK